MERSFTQAMAGSTLWRVTIDAMLGALRALGVDRDVKEYPSAGHSFLNHHSGWRGRATEVIGARYDPESADDAWQRIFTFFDRHLR